MPDEKRTKRLTASEREAIQRLNVLLDISVREPQHIDARLKLIKGGKRDMALITAKSKSLIEKLVETIPDDQLRMYSENLKLVKYVIGVRRPGDVGKRNDHDYGLWLPNWVINALLEGCHDKCLTCPADPEERRKCTLRKALTTIPNDTKERNDDDCPFYGLL